MSVETWRHKVSTSEGCKMLFESPNFKSDLTKCVIELHQLSIKLIQNTNNKSFDINLININFQKVILLYRTIRNLSSIKSQSKWIITQSNIISNIIDFLSIIFTKLCEIESLFTSSNQENELFVSLCDIIRAAFQIFCNLSFHSFDHNQNNNKNNIHSMLWQQFISKTLSSNIIILWIDKLLIAKWMKDKHKNNNIIIQTNISRILEPICAFLHEFIVNHSEHINDNELETIMKGLYNIQLIDIYCFGNNKNYLYQKINEKNDIKMDDNEIKDDFDKWKHHSFIRKLMPYFINSNGLIFYMNNLNTQCLKLHYFQVSIELLFEMTESILIDIKTPSVKQDVQLIQKKRIHLIQYALKNTLFKLINVIDYSMKFIFPNIFEKMKDKSEYFMIINICDNILEIICNVSLISTSISNKMEMIQYQNDLMKCFGLIMIESMRKLQNKSDELTKYCKANKISDVKFNKQYEQTVSKILSFRRQFTSIISTLCCNNKLNQDFIRTNGVIEMLLNMTKIDIFTMFLQQWSIFAIKNITTNNIENQKYIQNIKAQKVVQNEHMKTMGIKVTYDEITGKIIAKKQSDPK